MGASGRRFESAHPDRSFLSRDADRSPDSPKDVTVRADKLAFLQFFYDRLARACSDHRGDRFDLAEARQVVPVHHIRRKRSAAIGARDAFLERRHPSARRIKPYALALEASAPSSPTVVLAVVRVAALATVGQLSGSGPVKLADRLPLKAPRA